MEFKLTNLTYQYRSASPFTIGHLDLTIQSDLITSVIGANGSGKSTLIKILLRELVEITGSYTIDGVEERSLTGDLLYKQKIGYLPEVPILDDKLTGFELVSLAKDIRGVPDEIFLEELRRFEELLGVEEWFYSKRCSEYSLGMRKKSAIILAMTGPLNYLILDEPTNGLDPLAVYGLKKLISEKHEKGTGILITSHMLDFIEKVVDSVIFLKKGKIVHQDRLSSLLIEHADAASLDEIYFRLHTRETVYAE